MRLSELGGKEIINLFNGERLGIINNSDLVFDESTGKIHYLLIPKKRTPFFIFGERAKAEVAWDAIKKIGPDIIIIDMEDHGHKKYKDFTRGKNFT